MPFNVLMTSFKLKLTKASGPSSIGSSVTKAYRYIICDSNDLKILNKTDGIYFAPSLWTPTGCPLSIYVILL